MQAKYIATRVPGFSSGIDGNQVQPAHKSSQTGEALVITHNGHLAVQVNAIRGSPSYYVPQLYVWTPTQVCIRCNMVPIIIACRSHRNVGTARGRPVVHHIDPGFGLGK